MKTLVFFLGVSLLASCAKEVPSNKLVERAGVTYEVNSATPYSGRSVEYYVQRVDDEAAQQLKEARNYQDGRLHGVGESFYVNGQSETTGSWINGARDGIWTTFHPNGQIHHRGNYLNNLMEGSWESFGRDGENQETSTYMSGLLVLRSDDVDLYVRKAGIYRIGSTKPYTGIVETYYEDRPELVFERARYKDGLRDGVTEGFHENGRHSIRSYYTSSNLDGRYEEFYQNGQLAVEEIYQGGEQVGTATFYDAAGALREGFEESYVSGRLHRSNYKNGKRDGMWEQYREDGQLESRVSYKNGLEEGASEHYEDTGELTRNWNYKEGKRHGIQEDYHRGQLQSTSTYKEGKRHGIQEDYYHGQLQSTSTYKEGTLQEILEHFLVSRRNDVRYKWDSDSGKPIFYRIGSTKRYTGIVEAYYVNSRGLLQWRTRYKDGLKDGVTQGFYENAQLAQETIYREDEQVGATTFYDTTGTLREGFAEIRDPSGEFFTRANFVQGKPEGTEERYRTDGTLEHRISYKNGVKDGTSETYNDDGQLSRRDNYKNGLLDGFHEYYSDRDDGQLTSRQNYKNGLKHGLYENYTDGELGFTYNYKEGKKHGIADSFYEGKVQTRSYYENDVKLKSEDYHKGRVFSTTPYHDGKAGTTKYYY